MYSDTADQRKAAKLGSERHEKKAYRRYGSYYFNYFINLIPITSLNIKDFENRCGKEPEQYQSVSHSVR